MQEDRAAVGVAHRVDVRPGRQVHADPALAEHRDGRVRGLQQQPRPVLDRSAVAVGAQVGAVLQELVEQIAIGAVQFDAVEARRLGVGRRAAEVLHDPGDLLGLQRARGDERPLRPQQADRPFRGDGAGPHRRLAIQEIGVRDAADVPDLHEDPAAPVMHRLGHLLPALGLLGRPDAGDPFVADRLGRDRHAFADDQAGRSALGVVLCHQGVGDVGVGCPEARQGRHDQAVGQDEVAESQRIEQGSHGVLGQGMT